ncbi:MAG: chloride channel protein [Bacillota bacterium]
MPTQGADKNNIKADGSLIRGSFSLTSFILMLKTSEAAQGFLLAVVVGVAAALGAVAFRWLIGGFHGLFFDGGRHVLSFLGRFYVILIPAAGGLLVGPLVYCFAREAKGHGVPEVMEAVALKGGRIRPRVAVVKALASSICIGSGGSVGREGPIVQIGSAVGSAIGQWLRLPDETVKTLVACGAAGGISATFNAPIAGVFFALEVILGTVITRKFAYVIISAVTADFLSQVFLGDNRAFAVPHFGITSGWEFFFYVILGVLAGLAAFAFIRTLYSFEDLFKSIKMPEYIKPVLGGLAIGVIGLYSHDLFGVGYEGITKALSGQIVFGVLLALCLLKILATSLTIGSGGSGGVFAPSLFIGAMLGSALGAVVHSLFPSITAPAGAYGIVGMASVFAGAARAPFSAILIIFEMTRDYAIILPLMMTVVISTVFTRALMRETIYTLKLRRRGVDIEQGELADVMRTITVKEAMTRDFPVVPSTMRMEEFLTLFQNAGSHSFPVVDEKGLLAGIVAYADVQRSLGREKELTVGDIATKSPFVVYPDQFLDKVLKAAEEDYGRIPVVSREEAYQLVGILRRHDIIRAYRSRVRKSRAGGNVSAGY